MWGVWVTLINKINEEIEFKHEISIKCKKFDFLKKKNSKFQKLSVTFGYRKMENKTIFGNV